MTTFFNSPKASWIWLVLRLYVGYEWLTAGWHKLTGEKAFDATAFLKGGVAKAVPAAPGARPVVQAWWADFLNGFAIPNVKLFNILIPWGEFLVGLALILGFATLFAAVMGMVMNFAFLLSGTVSTNPNLLALEFLIVALGGAYAGYLGLDYWVRPHLRRLLKLEVPRTAAFRA